MTLEVENEAHPRAAVMLADAGWSPHPTWGVFTRGTLVMGGDLMGGFHVKNWGMDIHGPDTPDTAEEAAEWLVQRFAIPADVVTFADAPEPEPVHDDLSASDSGGADAGDGDASLSGESDTGDAGGDGASAESAGNGAGDQPGVGDSDPDDTADFLSSDGDVESSDPIDADFTVHDLDTIELIEPDEPDFGRELLEFEDELAGEPAPAADASGAFIFGDNLHQMRTAAIGLVSTHAAILTAEIEAASGEQEGEYADLQSLVVTNLDKHTGAFTLQDAPSLMRYHRWSELDATRAAVRTIDRVRKEKTAFLLSAERAEIEAFDPSEGWP